MAHRGLGLIPWRATITVLSIVTLVVALVPALRWPTIRVVAAGATTLSAPLRPDVDEFGPLDKATKIVDRSGRLISRPGPPGHFAPIPLDRVPMMVRQAVLAAEDRRFYDHPGIDPMAITRAAGAQLKGGDQGGSTISQQLAKLNFTDGGANLVRKVREAFYTAELEREFTKDQLLERYLNQVYLGDSAYGLQAASQVFFGVDVRELDVAQAATLAGKIRAPDALDPHEVPDAVIERRDQVIAAMADEGWITPGQAEAARSAPLEVLPQQAPPPSKAPWFVEYVKQELGTIEELGPDAETRVQKALTEGYVIETTLDLPANAAADEAVRESLGGENDPTAAVVSVQPNDGAIRVMVGGVDFARQQFNAAAQARRQPGSAFKPFVYLAALAEGIDPRSRMSGPAKDRFEYDGRSFEVRNYGNKGFGSIDLDEALAKSVNTVYMDLGLEVGPEAVVDIAADAGLSDKISPVPAVALGGIDAGTTPLEMATAYAALAAEGTYAEPYAIARVIDADGDVVFERTPDPRQRLERDHVLVLNRPLLRVVREGTGRAAALDRDVAGKTGTSSEFRDAWFVGYVPQLATAVWVGHLDNRPMTETKGRISGGSIPASIFHDVMVKALGRAEPVPISTLDPGGLDLRKLKRAKKSDSDTTTTSSTTTTTAVEPGGSTTTTTQPPAPSPPPAPSSSTTSSSTSSSTTSSTTTTAPPSSGGSANGGSGDSAGTTTTAPGG